jgi:hypothetical protein
MDLYDTRVNDDWCGWDQSVSGIEFFQKRQEAIKQLVLGADILILELNKLVIQYLVRHWNNFEIGDLVQPSGGQGTAVVLKTKNYSNDSISFSYLFWESCYDQWITETELCALGQIRKGYYTTKRQDRMLKKWLTGTCCLFELFL